MGGDSSGGSSGGQQQQTDPLEAPGMISLFQGIGGGQGFAPQQQQQTNVPSPYLDALLAQIKSQIPQQGSFSGQGQQG